MPNPENEPTASSHKETAANQKHKQLSVEEIAKALGASEVIPVSSTFEALIIFNSRHRKIIEENLRQTSDDLDS